MTEISIQLDENILRALESTAAKNNTSVSEWIKDRIYRELKQEWPENYFSLFGVLDENDLHEPPEIPFEHETKREAL